MVGKKINNRAKVRQREMIQRGQCRRSCNGRSRAARRREERGGGGGPVQQYLSMTFFFFFFG